MGINSSYPGLYIHIPFCKSKCPYCDFYSLKADGELMSSYVESLSLRLKEYKNQKYETVYFGGGTPSLIGADNIARLLSLINTAPGAEITVECNPSDSGSDSGFDFKTAADAGVNRISLGLQSADDDERRGLGRLAGADKAQRAIERAFAAGITNISLDLMLGISGQNENSLHRSIDFCLKTGAKHISAYMLKIEPGTFYYNNFGKLLLPDEDTVCDLYLQCCCELEAGGLKQYEISNFACPGFESRHNLKYWHCEEYLGLGPAAHSFVDGKRFYYERDINAFINNDEPVDDGDGGSFDEYVMLALRLSEGLRFDKVKERFGIDVPPTMIKKAVDLSRHGLTDVTNDAITLTRKGFLLSNAVIAELID